MRPKIYIDGQSGTTGLQINERLGARQDIELLRIDEALRHDKSERRKLLHEADIAFLCLPDDAAQEAVELAQGSEVRIIDASTAHRTAPGWTYGFPELCGQREKIAASPRVANPGCYATGFISLVRPLTECGFLRPDAPLVCHALSGYTGAGKKAIAQYTDSARDPELDSPRHYGMALHHKHLPEMVSLGGLTRSPIFCPIICDYPRGMVVTVPVFLSSLEKKTGLEGLKKLYADYYAGSPVIGVMPDGTPEDGFLGANNLAGTDRLQIFVGGNGEQALLAARLDNLGKGASGAAVQNMNIMLGLPETTGLDL